MNSKKPLFASGVCCAMLLLCGCPETDPPVMTSDMGVDITPDEGQVQGEDMPEAGTNSRPVAAPGASRTVNVGEQVVLDGSGSFDGDGDALTYQWFLARPQSSDSMLMDEVASVARFTPDVAGAFEVELIVNDGIIDSLPATLTITVMGEDLLNTPPVADAGINRQVEVGERVELDAGASSDPEGEPLTYAWSLLGAPEGSLAQIADQEARVASITPDVEGMYQLRLIVNDGLLGSNPALLTLTAVAEAPENQAPVARQSGDQSVEVGDVVTLDGGSSQDPDGDDITYMWTLDTPAGSSAFLSAPEAFAPTFTPDVAGAYTATLTVRDAELSSAPVSATITASLGNQAPTARVGMSRSALVGEELTLDGGSSSDPEGQALTYAWTLSSRPAGSSAQMMDATTMTPTFTPDVPGDYLAALTVSDGELDSALASVLITVIEPCMLISEYIEGSANNKALEFYNCSGQTLPLDMIKVCLYTNTDVDCPAGEARPFTEASLPHGGVTVLCNGRADLPEITAACNGRTSSATNYNGNDRLVLFVDMDDDGGFDASVDTLLDAFGQLNVLAPSDTAWSNKTFERCSVTPYDGFSSFDPLTYFDEEDEDTASNLGVAPLLNGCTP